MMTQQKKPIIVLSVGILLILIFSLFLNLPYIHLREFQGEEGRRVIIAKNMLETGEWVVPYVEGKVYLNKPPLFNWMLAGLFQLTGVISETSARAVSVIAAFLCAVSLSLFWRKTVGITTVWFILPGLIFLTFTDVMDKAVRAEIDMSFTFFVTSALVTWFYCFEMKKRELAAWFISLSLISLGALTKGIQAPAFFYCGVIPYLFYKKQARKIYSLSHLAGLFAFVFIFAMWFLPLVGKIDPSDVLHAWFREIVSRKEPLREGGFLRHFIEFPFQYIIAFLPWIPMLALWMRKPLQEEPVLMKDLAFYCLFFLVVSLPVYWLLPGARLRYIMPLSGNLALLLAIPIHAVMSGNIRNGLLSKRYFQVFGVSVMLAVLSAPFWARKFALFGNPVSITLLIVLLFVSFSLVWQKREIGKQIGLLFLITLLLKVCWASFYFPYHANHLSHYRNAAKQINLLVPPDAKLYDYEVDNGHLAYYLQRPVTLIDSLDNIVIDNGYFLFMEDTSAEHLNLKGFSYIGNVKARRMKLVVYRSASSL
jgi:4-amino-4-deoxy-L-arabinose transferase-like glycosyltransferase